MPRITDTGRDKNLSPRANQLRAAVEATLDDLETAGYKPGVTHEPAEEAKVWNEGDYGGHTTGPVVALPFYDYGAREAFLLGSDEVDGLDDRLPGVVEMVYGFAFEYAPEDG